MRVITSSNPIRRRSRRVSTVSACSRVMSPNSSRRRARSVFTATGNARKLMRGACSASVRPSRSAPMPRTFTSAARSAWAGRHRRFCASINSAICPYVKGMTPPPCVAPGGEHPLTAGEGAVPAGPAPPDNACRSWRSRAVRRGGGRFTPLVEGCEAPAAPTGRGGATCGRWCGEDPRPQRPVLHLQWEVCTRYGGLRPVRGFAPGTGAARAVLRASVHLLWGFAPGAGARRTQIGR